MKYKFLLTITLFSLTSVQMFASRGVSERLYKPVDISTYNRPVQNENVSRSVLAEKIAGLHAERNQQLGENLHKVETKSEAVSEPTSVVEVDKLSTGTQAKGFENNPLKIGYQQLGRMVDSIRSLVFMRDGYTTRDVAEVALSQMSLNQADRVFVEENLEQAPQLVVNGSENSLTLTQKIMKWVNDFMQWCSDMLFKKRAEEQLKQRESLSNGLQLDERQVDVAQAVNESRGAFDQRVFDVQPINKHEEELQIPTSHEQSAAPQKSLAELFAQRGGNTVLPGLSAGRLRVTTPFAGEQSLRQTNGMQGESTDAQKVSSLIDQAVQKELAQFGKDPLLQIKGPGNARSSVVKSLQKYFEDQAASEFAQQRAGLIEVYKKENAEVLQRLLEDGDQEAVTRRIDRVMHEKLQEAQALKLQAQQSVITQAGNDVFLQVQQKIKDMQKGDFQAIKPQAPNTQTAELARVKKDGSNILIEKLKKEEWEKFNQNTQFLNILKEKLKDDFFKENKRLPDDKEIAQGIKDYFDTVTFSQFKRDNKLAIEKAGDDRVLSWKNKKNLESAVNENLSNISIDQLKEYEQMFNVLQPIDSSLTLTRFKDKLKQEIANRSPQ